MNTLLNIQTYLKEKQLDGWLLYDFRGQNPIALHIAGLQNSGTRRWFLWIPTQGAPIWLIHAIEGSTFEHVSPEIKGQLHYYSGWQELERLLGQIVHTTSAQAPRIAMEYSPNNAIPYVSKVDAGTKEMVERTTGAEIVSSADLVQQTQAILTEAQVESHRRAAAHCFTAKDAAFDFIRQSLGNGQSITEYDVQQVIMDTFAKADLDPDHPPIVAVNANAADPHYAPTPNRHQPVKRGDMVLIDLWAKERNSPQDCFADITWTAYCGSDVPEQVAHIFDVAAAGRDAVVAFIQKKLDLGQPVYGYEADDVCRQIIQEAGYGGAILHRTGHSLGPEVHFNGANLDNLESQDRRQLIPGIMFTIEPGIYKPTFNFDGSSTAKGLGIRTEINCFMHSDRVEVTTLPLQSEVVPLL